jgi:hypothetical protein
LALLLQEALLRGISQDLIFTPGERKPLEYTFSFLCNGATCEVKVCLEKLPGSITWSVKRGSEEVVNIRPANYPKEAAMEIANSFGVDLTRARSRISTM